MELWRKMAEGSGTKWWICSSITFLVKMKNVFYFYLKTEGTFWLTQYTAILITPFLVACVIWPQIYKNSKTDGCQQNIDWPKSSFGFKVKVKDTFHFHQELSWTTYSPFCSTTSAIFQATSQFHLPKTFYLFELRTVPGAFYSLPGNWNFFH